MAEVEVSQGGLEVGALTDDTNVKVSQGGLEVGALTDDTNIEVSQGGLEVGSFDTDTELRIYQGGVEVVYLSENDFRVSQMGVEFADKLTTPAPPVPPITGSPLNIVCHPPYAQLLFPVEDGEWEVAPLFMMGVKNGTLLVSLAGIGTPPLHYLSQRGPYQHGSTPLDFRWDERTVEMEIFKGQLGNKFHPDFRWRLLDYLRPSRTFYTGVTEPKTIKFRYWLPGGQLLRGEDLELTAGSPIVYSPTGRFIHNGLEVGERFTIIDSTADDGDYTVAAITNDYNVTLSGNMTNTETGIRYQFRMAQAWRELLLLMLEGPDFGIPNEIVGGGISDIISFIASDPFWYGKEQSQTFDLGTSFDALVFDDPDYDAWFGENPGEGSWLFAESYLSRSVNMVYWGHEPVTPIIEITGPATVPIITNDISGVSLVFNYGVSAGQVVTIDTLNLTVTDNFGTTGLYAYLTGDVVTFKLAPDPEAPNRVNIITVTFSGATPSSAVQIKWQNRYINL